MKMLYVIFYIFSDGPVVQTEESFHSLKLCKARIMELNIKAKCIKVDIKK
jgi:hypothetical protein